MRGRCGGEASSDRVVDARACEQPLSLRVRQNWGVICASPSPPVLSLVRQARRGCAGTRGIAWRGRCEPYGALTVEEPTKPVSTTAAAQIGKSAAGVPSCAAMGSASATVTARGVTARVMGGGRPSRRPASAVVTRLKSDAPAAQPNISAACRLCSQ